MDEKRELAPGSDGGGWSFGDCGGASSSSSEAYARRDSMVHRTLLGRRYSKIEEERAGTDNGEMESVLLTLELRSYARIFQERCLGDSVVRTAKLKQEVAKLVKLLASRLEKDNENLTKIYTSAMNNMADELECRIKSQNLKEEIKRGCSTS